MVEREGASPEVQEALVGALLDQQPRVATDDRVAQLSVLCRAAVQHFPVSGAAISVVLGQGLDAVAAWTDADARRFVEMQFTAGEGPCLDAARSLRPVLVPDLGSVARSRWPGYLSLASDAGLGAAFSVPLKLGSTRLGVLDLFSRRPTTLDEVQVATLLAFGRAATDILLADVDATDPDRTSALLDSMDYRAEVYQAQGMLMIRLGVDLAEALTRLRVHAFVNGRSTVDVAMDIVARRAPGPEDL